MIKEIVVANEANYSDEGCKLDNLKQINFVYGANGTGKTTISRVVSNPEQYTDCSIKWSDQDQQRCLVYNRHFINANFADKMKGVFTLGEEDVSTMEAIKTLKKEIDDLNSAISSRTKSLDGKDDTVGKIGELARTKNDLADSVWEYQKKYSEDFEQAFKGERGAKKTFRDRLLKEYSEIQNFEIPSFEELKKKAETVFDSEIDRLENVTEIDFSTIIALESSNVLQKKIVGADDIDIAPLIKELSNSDWVKQGIQYLDKKENTCPFCQQDVDDSLRQKLGSYFDETYLSDIDKIEALQADYQSEVQSISDNLSTLLNSEPRYLNKESIDMLSNQLFERFRLNLQHLVTKRKEPSRSIELETITPLANQISEGINQANSNIGEHNELFKNSGQASLALISDVWRFIVMEAKPILDSYKLKKEELDKAIEGLRADINLKEQKLVSKRQKLTTLEKKITSVQPTVDEINRLLNSFGFQNFSLQTAGEESELYEIVRPDGSNAAETLSEGEKSFITFLYFYQLIRGSTSQSGLVEDRIIVIDDPVSSLDSDVLFVVSSLIKQLLKEACEGSGSIKQVFVLTHNIYFHKEVSFDPKRGDACRSHETFWIVRKSDQSSIIEGFNHNPIKTSYELLWESLREGHYSNLTIQNTLRRILENYFKVLGDIDFNEITERFDGKDRQVCGSLFSWVHDGSHNAFDDDLYLSTDQSIIDRYLKVFQEIFYKLNQKPHYDMMMRHAITTVKGTNSVADVDSVGGL